MIHFYIVLTEAFCIQYENYTRDNLVFGYSTTNIGQLVTSVNSLNEFPEIFEGIDLSIVILTKSDFPETGKTVV
jgi:hypothetical protein